MILLDIRWCFAKLILVMNLHCLLTACLSLTCQRVTQAHSARWQMVTNANNALSRELKSWQLAQYCWQLMLRLVLGWEFVGSPGLINSLCRCWRQTADTAPRDFGPYQRWHPTLQHHHHPSWVFTLGVCGLVVQMEEVLCSTKFQYMLPYLSLAIRGALQILNLANTMLEYVLGQKKEREKTRCWNALYIGEKLCWWGKKSNWRQVYRVEWRRLFEDCFPL